MRKLYLTFGLLSLTGTMLLPLQAQNSTNLPTSMYGIGELSPGDGGRLSGMGNVGIALNRLGFQNTLNPAAITQMDSTCFTFDVGASGAYARYSYLSDRSSSLTANPNRFSLGFRLRRRWYMMLGAAPYSSVGYLIRTEEPVEGLPGQYVYSSFQGEGGLYRCYLTNAVRLSPRLSVGLNVGMVLGTVTQSETQESATVEYESKKRAFYVDLGVHYDFNPQGERRWSVGVVFAPFMPLSHDNELTYENSSIEEGLEKSYHSSQEYLPLHLGAGVAMISIPIRQSFLSLSLGWRRQMDSSSTLMQESRWSLNLNLTFGERLSRSRLK